MGTKGPALRQRGQDLGGRGAVGAMHMKSRERGVVWCGVVWCGVVWCGVVWCCMVWCGVVGEEAGRAGQVCYSSAHASDTVSVTTQ